MIYFLIVVTVGGNSSITGPFLASLLLGIADVAGKYYVPELGGFFIYTIMIVVLLVRPQGLFARGRSEMEPAMQTEMPRSTTVPRLLVQRHRWRMAEIQAFWLAAAASYFLLPGKHLLLNEIAILALFALSLDIVLGYAGIVSLGHAAFFGMGAYAAGLSQNTSTPIP